MLDDLVGDSPTDVAHHDGVAQLKTEEVGRVDSNVETGQDECRHRRHCSALGTYKGGHLLQGVRRGYFRQAEGRSGQVRDRRFHQNLPVQARFSRNRGRRRPVERRIPLPRCIYVHPGTRPHSCSSSGPRRDDFPPSKRPLWRSDSNYEKFAGRARKGVPCLVMGSPGARVTSLRRGLFTLSYSCRSPPHKATRRSVGGDEFRSEPEELGFGELF